MPKLIGVFAGCTGYFIGFVFHRLIHQKYKSFGQDLKKIKANVDCTVQAVHKAHEHHHANKNTLHPNPTPLYGMKRILSPTSELNINPNGNASGYLGAGNRSIMPKIRYFYKYFHFL